VSIGSLRADLAELRFLLEGKAFPIGKVSTHKDGSKWKKVKVGEDVRWVRVTGKPRTKATKKSISKTKKSAKSAPKAITKATKSAPAPDYKTLESNSKSLTVALKERDPALGAAIDTFESKAHNRGYDEPAKACGECDRSTGDFVKTAPASAGLKRYRFDTLSADGVERMRKLYGMSDKAVKAMKKRDASTLRHSGPDMEEAMFHEVAVTPDGYAIDFTANQFADWTTHEPGKRLPVPFVFKIDHTKNSKPGSDIVHPEEYVS
jgi:hypothetical protein